MSDDATARLVLPFLAAGQAQKEVTHNEALQRLDALVQPVAETADLAAPPSSPAPGQCWIVGTDATDSWAGHDGDIAQWTDGGWRFVRPLAGWRCHVADRGARMIHDGSAWRDDAVRADGLYVAGQRVVGPRKPMIAAPAGGSVIDSEARAVIAAILTTLQDHGLIG